MGLPSVLDDHAFKQAIESVKLRAPIEEIVRERIPELRRAGSLWTACCPFHEEKTPSFKVDPRRGSWHCFGSCSTGGDAIGFIQRFDNLTFWESLEILAARTGVELPQRSKGRPSPDEALYELLERAALFYTRRLAGDDGAPARKYLADRGLGAAACEAFGVGFAPAAGRALVEHATNAGVPLAKLVGVGLAREREDKSGAYDFFRGRLMIPIKDQRGRVVGFGGRCLPGDEERGPKYVNTAETPVFQKSRLIYGLDRALEHVRRNRHLVLVEGYTDVIAAHQAGVSNVAAVLGTSTTEDHAGLVRRSGARRVSLVFDGDEAGRRAALRALNGLLPLDLELEVVTLPAGVDPCDLFVQGGADAFEAELSRAHEWFEFALAGLAGLPPSDLAREADGVFELLARLSRPLDREARLARMAAFLDLPEAGVREQYAALAKRRRPPASRRPQPGAQPREDSSAAGSTGSGSAWSGSTWSGPSDAAAPSAAELAEMGSAAAGDAAELAPATPRAAQASVNALRDLMGAVLLDPSLAPRATPHLEVGVDSGAFPDEVAAIARAILALTLDEDDLRPIDAARVMAELGADPARDAVVSLEEHARRAESATVLAAGACDYFESKARNYRLRQRGQSLTGLFDDPTQKELLRDIYREMTAG